MRFARNPIYATLHESSYADGVADALVGGAAAARRASRQGLLHGRARLPVDVGGLRLRCGRTRRRRDPGRARLAAAVRRRAARAATRCPVAATIYVNDLYVERDFAEETAALIRGLRPWITNEYEHNGLRADGERVLGRLIDMLRGAA